MSAAPESRRVIGGRAERRIQLLANKGKVTGCTKPSANPLPGDLR